MADDTVAARVDSESATRGQAVGREQVAGDAENRARTLASPRRPFIEQRLVAAFGGRPLFAGVLVALLAFAAYLLWAFALREPLAHRFVTNVGLQPNVAWTAVVWSALLGYMVVVMSVVPERARADTLLLMAFVPPAARGDIQKHFQYTGATLRRGQRVGAISAVAGLLGLSYSAWAILTPPSLMAFVPQLLIGFGWYLIVVPAVVFLQGRAAFIMLNGSRLGRSMIMPAVQFDILDLAPFAPFARMALSNAGAWLTGAFIISLFFLRAPFKDVASITVLGGLSLALAIAALANPFLAVHRVIVARKRSELEVVHAAIDRDRALLLARSADATAAAQRLQGLLAYRTAVENAREWPINVSVLVRFGLYMVLPMLGWTAGALVDHFINGYLGAH